MEGFSWITINYHLPMTPSGSRVYAWRKLKELGAAYLRQGVAVLPYSDGNVHKVQTLAAKIRTMDGQCTLTEMRFLDEKDHRRMVETFKTQSKDEFKELLLDAARLYEHLGGSDVGGDKSMRKRYLKAKSRDYFDIEDEISDAGFFGELFSDLNMEGGWTELLSDLRQSCKDVSKMVAGLIPEQYPGTNRRIPTERNERNYDDSDA